MYEVVWTRLLTLELGHTVAAASTVLAAFMGGLAAGAFAAGRVATRLAPRRALRAYAAIEIAIGVFALLVPLLIRLVHPLLSLTYRAGEGGLAFELSRLTSALLLVGLPAFVMGATYPLLVRATAIAHRAAASLYAANTIGAAVGALAAGFLLLRFFGATGATAIAAFGNTVVAAIAWRLRPAADDFETGERPTVPAAPSRTPVLWPALAAAAVGGGGALMLEVAWTRTLAMVIGPTTYAFSAMVGCFISALAVGSAAGAALARRVARPLAWIGVLFALASLATAMAIADVPDAVLDVARRAADPGASLGRLLIAEVIWAARLVGPAAVCFGALFPMVLLAADAATPRRAAHVYAANTVGAIAGSLGGGLAAIPYLGVHGTFVLAMAVSGLAGLAAAAMTARRAPLVALLAAAACSGAALIVSAHPWNPKLMSSGAYKYSAYVSSPALQEVLPDLLQAGSVVFYREGATGTVAVRDLTGVRSLSIDGKVDASNGGDMITQRLLAHLPLLTHQRAGRVGIVGLGSGVTLGAALTHPVRSAEVIEISPQVVDASAWFKAENRGALEDRRVRLVRGDARTHFRLERGARYDVIISEPSNPWMAGVAALFTREFFEALRSSLAAGGIVCQWTHTYDISKEDLQSIVATFSRTFPDVAMWLAGDGDLLLIGGLAPGATAFERTIGANAPPDALRDLSASGIRSIRELGALYLGDADLARRWSDGATVQSDDRMSLEFSAPASTVGATRTDNAADLLHAAGRDRPAPGENPGSTGALLLETHAPRRAWPYLAAAIESGARDRSTVAAYVRAAALVSRLDEAERALAGIASREAASAGVRLELAKLLAARGDVQRAWEQAAIVADGAPGEPAAVEALASIAADAENPDRLRPAVGRLRQLRPGDASTQYYDGVLQLLSGDVSSAQRLARGAVTANPAHAAAWNLLGVALGAANAPPDDIGDAFRRAIAADPTDPAAYVNLATLHLRTGRSAEAVDAFAQALTLDPAHAGAREGLLLARR